MVENSFCILHSAFAWLSVGQQFPMMPDFELVAQLVEHRTFNPWVVGSIPTELI